MRGNCGWADPQRQCDLLVSLPAGEKSENVGVTTRELVRQPAPRIPRAR